ncbi:hypothetical protein [Streptosporangium subroseum]|uniref:hypothetical protein n=1 Tax=Streptosporangium subroseum TaxID=106412 RepID=UPI0030918ABB|nr:hypothetical protein OHB15_50415 [Streptosporangium subroseum]
MPSVTVVPEGAHRRFLLEVFQMYRSAGRPTLRQIVKRATEMNLPGSASSETVRRTLKGLVIPERWETAYAVYAPLCDMAKVDPEAEYYEEENNGYQDEPPKITHRELLIRLWSAAFDDVEDLPLPVLRSKVPWPLPSPPPSRFGNDLSDEPPF